MKSRSSLMLFVLLILFITAACSLLETGEGDSGAVIKPDGKEEGVPTGQETAWETQMWSNLERQEPTEVAPRVGFLAPPFSLPDLQGSDTGTDHFCGEDLFLFFWQLECPDCESVLDLLQEMHDSGHALTVIAINVLDEEVTVREFVQSRGYTFTVLLDRDGHLFRNYELHSFPTTIAVNGLREIVSIRSGPLVWDELERMRELMQRWELRPIIK